MSIDFESTGTMYVDFVGSLSHLQNVAGATMTAWILAESTVATGVICGLTIGTSTSSTRHSIEQPSAQAGVVSRRLDADAILSTPGGTITAAVLAHVAGVAVYNGASQLLYVNGVQVASASPAGWTGNSSNTASQHGVIGADEGLAGGFYDGRIQDVRIYNRALSADEINDIFLARGRDSITLGLQSRFKMIELPPGTAVSGASVKDSGVQGVVTSQHNSPPYAEWLVSSRRRRTG